MDLGIAGRRALVTGSYRGTGAATAAVLASEGAHVVVHGFEDGQPDDVVAAIEAEGGAASGLVLDLSDDDVVADGLSRLELDIVVCNYGIAGRGRWGGPETGSWVDAFDRNVLTAVRVIEATRPGLVERGWGRIVLLGTIGSVRPAAIRPQYYSAKAALPGLCVSLAQDLAGTGVTANLVSPGLIATDEVLARLGDRDPSEVFGSELAPLTGEVTTPEQVASLVAYVCSEQAGAITGTNLHIDGGSSRTVTP